MKIALHDSTYEVETSPRGWQTLYFVASALFMALASLAAVGAFLPSQGPGGLKFLCGVGGGALTLSVAAFVLGAVTKQHEIRISGYKEKFFKGTLSLRELEGVKEQLACDLPRGVKVNSSGTLSEAHQSFCDALSTQAGCGDFCPIALGCYGWSSNVGIGSSNHGLAYSVDIFKNQGKDYIRLSQEMKIFENERALAYLTMSILYDFEADEAVIRWQEPSILPPIRLWLYQS